MLLPIGSRLCSRDLIHGWLTPDSSCLGSAQEWSKGRIVAWSNGEMVSKMPCACGLACRSCFNVDWITIKKVIETGECCEERSFLPNADLGGLGCA